MSEVCTHCKSILKNKSILGTHLKTNKKCIALRGLIIDTKFICEGCKINCVAMKHLVSHHDSCKDYQKIIIERNYREQDNEFKEKLKAHETRYKEKIQEQETKYNTLKDSFDSIQKQYIKQIEKLQDQISSIAKEAVNRPTTTNNTINHIRNNLSTKYTLDELKDAEILDICRENLTEPPKLDG